MEQQIGIISYKMENKKGVSLYNLQRCFFYGCYSEKENSIFVYMYFNWNFCMCFAAKECRNDANSEFAVHQ